MSDAEWQRARIVETLARAGFADARVEITGAASVGASRATLFFDLRADGETTRCVAQLGASQGAHAASVEAALLRLAHAAGVPVPRVLAAADDACGEPGGVLITSALPGLSIPREILRSLPDAAAGDRLAAECGAALARLHAIAPATIPAPVPRLAARDPHGDYVRALTDALGELPTHHPAIRWGLNWLRRNPPAAPPRLALVHADFRNGNMLVADGRLRAMLDWELAHVGDPMEDLAWLCVRMWRFGHDDRPCGGFGSLDALRRGYESAGGAWRADAFHWWLVARSAWWGIGLARQCAAFRAGESDSIVHAASGRRVPELEYDVLTLIRAQRS